LVLTAVFCYFYFSTQFIDMDDNEVKKKSRDAAIKGYKTAFDSPISPSEKFWNSSEDEATEIGGGPSEWWETERSTTVSPRPTATPADWPMSTFTFTAEVATEVSINNQSIGCIQGWSNTVLEPDI